MLHIDALVFSVANRYVLPCTYALIYTSLEHPVSSDPDYFNSSFLMWNDAFIWVLINFYEIPGTIAMLRGLLACIFLRINVTLFDYSGSFSKFPRFLFGLIHENNKDLNNLATLVACMTVRLSGAAVSGNNWAQLIYVALWCYDQLLFRE